MAPEHRTQAPPAPAPAPDPRTLLTVSEAARRAGVSRQALTRRVKRETVASTRIEVDGEVQVRVSLDALLDAYPEADASPVEEEGTQGSAPVAPQVPHPAPAPAPTPQEPAQRALAVLVERHRGEVVELRGSLERARADRDTATRRAWTFASVAGVTLALATGAGVAAWTTAGRAVHAEEQAAQAEGRAVEVGDQLVAAQVEVGTTRAELERAALVVAEQERRAAEAEARADAVTQERDAALERLRAIEVAQIVAVVMRQLAGFL